MISERELTKNMKAELKRNRIKASIQDFEDRRDHLIEINDGFHDVLDFIPDFIMIDLLEEYNYFSLTGYSNIDEFADGVLGYGHGMVQQMRKIAKHFYVFNPNTKEYELDEDFRGFSPKQLEIMSKWSKQELLNANIEPSMTVYEIDAKVRENGLKRSIRVTDEEFKIIKSYSIADDTTKIKIRELLKL